MFITPSLMLLAVAAFCQEAPPKVPAFTPEEIAAAQKDPKRFQIADESFDIRFQGLEQRPVNLPPPSVELPTDELVVVDHIINIGRKIWTIVEENRPVVDVKTQYAAAVPEGITHWAQLTGWDTPKATVYGFLAKNAYGGKMVDVKYAVTRTTGGAFKGKGRYLTGVTIEPLRVEVGWGYRFTMTAEVPSVTNADKTGDDPLAGMMVNIKWRIQTPLKDSQGTGVYYVRGDGLFVEVGGPFSRTEVTQVAERVKSIAVAGGPSW
ncbi:MAG: hypothetical protein HY925_00015 [Elusimicrobia bacterium]|nr:hypothetical protein [Elusimicrobiota bacterium]